MSSPDQLYYDLDVANTFNPGIVPNSYPAINRLSFTEVRSSPIVDNPSDYYLSIVRFSLDTAGSMPIMIPQIDLNQTLATPNQPNATVYYITLKYDDGVNPVVYRAERVIFVSQTFTNTGTNGTPQPPTLPLNLEKATANYYWLQSFQFFINMVNTAIADAYAGLYALINQAPYTPLPADITAPAAGIYPYILWSNETNKATMVFPQITPFSYTQDYFNLGNSKVSIYMNNELYVLFSSFESILNQTYINPASVPLDGDRANYLIQNYDKKNSNFRKGATAGNEGFPFDCLLMEQPYSTGAIMSPIQSLVFTTSLVPVVPSLIGIPRIVENTQSSSGQNDNINNEITDLVVNVVRGDEWFPNVLYLPQAEYRLIDLQGNTPLYGFQISVMWKDIYGIYHDFFLQNGCNCSLKVLFRKKNLG